MDGSEGSKKAILVYDKDGRTLKILRELLRLCGHECYAAFRYGDALPPDTRPSLILICEAEGAPEPGACPLFVTDCELSSIPGFASHPHKITYSTTRNDADFTLRNIRLTKEGLVAFEIVGIGIIGRVKLKTDDTSAAAASLAAASAAIGAGIPFADVLAALCRVEFV